MKSRKVRYQREGVVKVKPQFKRGCGRWMLVTCPNGSLLNQIPYGSMTDGKRALKAKTHYCGCAGCTRE